MCASARCMIQAHVTIAHRTVLVVCYDKLLRQLHYFICLCLSSPSLAHTHTHSHPFPGLDLCVSVSTCSFCFALHIRIRSGCILFFCDCVSPFWSLVLCFARCRNGILCSSKTHKCVLPLVAAEEKPCAHTHTHTRHMQCVDCGVTADTKCRTVLCSVCHATPCNRPVCF